MKKQQKLQDAIGMVGEDLIHQAKARKKKSVRVWQMWYIPTVAAALVVTLVIGTLYWPRRGPIDEDGLATVPPKVDSSDYEASEPSMPPPSSGTATAPEADGNTATPGGQAPIITVGRVMRLAAPTYPTTAIYPDRENSEAYTRYLWEEFLRKQEGKAALAGDIDHFIAETMAEFLDGQGNQIYSPLNLYVSLAMMAEMTAGESRQQILELLDVEEMESLREKVSNLWNSNYRDDTAVTSILANSVWLNDLNEYDQDLLDRIAELYYASSYEGTPGTEAFDQALQNWFDEQTNDLLQEQVGNLSTDRNMVLNLASSINYRGLWSSKFQKEKTAEGIFHGTNGDTLQMFMNATAINDDYYWGDQFTAVYQEVIAGGGMWLILPDEGVELSSLLTDPQVQKLINGDETENTRKMKIHLSVPKFDVASDTDLITGLKNLGITDVFDSRISDFSPLSSTIHADGKIKVSDMDHAARVTIDENGCTAAGFTSSSYTVDAWIPERDEVNFVVDRPFLFAITSEHDIPLFMGTIQNP